MTPLSKDIGPSATNPFTWRSPTCVIALGNGHQIVTPAYPVILVAHVAALIAKECRYGQRGFLGGTVRLGGDRGGVVVANKS